MASCLALEGVGQLLAAWLCAVCIYQLNTVRSELKERDHSVGVATLISLGDNVIMTIAANIDWPKWYIDELVERMEAVDTQPEPASEDDWDFCN